MPGTTTTGMSMDFSEFNQRLVILRNEFEDEAAEMVLEVGDAFISEAQRRTPIDEAFLVNSAAVEPVANNPLAVDIGFNADYAAAVHEDLNARHSQGEAKFLEKAITEEGERIMAAQTEEMGRRLGTK